MARQIIDLGTLGVANSGEGLRLGGDKINDNFAELYAEKVSGKSTNEYALAFSDPAGNVILGVDTEGRLVANFDLATGGQLLVTTLGKRIFSYSIGHVFVYGQSLSVGQALPVISLTQNYDNLMFTRGMRPQYDYPTETAAEWYAGLVPAVEAASPENANLGETPATGLGDMVKRLIEEEDGISFTDHEYQMLLSAPGYGGTRIDGLDNVGTNTEHFDRMIEQATYGKALANAAGKTYGVEAVTWTQGESDYLSNITGASYLSSLNTLIADTNTEIKAVTGQSEDVVFIGSQIATHLRYAADDVPDIALAQLECEETNPLFFIACAMYHLPYQNNNDNGHLTGVGSRLLAKYLGLAKKRIVNDGFNWRPVVPLVTRTQGRVIEVTFNVPKGHLVFDTTLVAAQPNMGFGLVDDSESALTISSVEIIDYNRVRFLAAADVPAGARLRYGWDGPENHGRGNLRDTQGDTLTTTISGTVYALHNFSLIFDKEL